MGPKTKISKIFKKIFGEKKSLTFQTQPPIFLHSKMKIEHIYQLLATRIINFHLFLQNILDLEVWTRFPNFPIFFYSHFFSQLWTPGHISSCRMNFDPKSILGGSLGCREPRKTQILMAQGSPLAGKFTKVGILLVDPFRRSGSTWYLKGSIIKCNEKNNNSRNGTGWTPVSVSPQPFKFTQPVVSTTSGRTSSK